MPDEQIIYLDPNDELTRVREKIEEVPARRIIMVVPQQTQLRSNVGWRLLHARARALGKEVQVISPDRQVRAVAKAAGFRVSQPQEGSSTSKTRVPPTQPPPSQRGVTERRGVQRSRGPVNRGPVDNRAARLREPLSPPPVREEPPPTISQPETRPPQSTWRQQENPPTRPEEPGELTSRQGEEEAFPSEEIFEDDALDQPFEFRIDQAQGELHTARPLIARPEEEEHQDPFIPDYDTSRRIREAALEGASGGESNPPLRDQDPASAFPPSRYSTPPEPARTNPFENDIEELSPSLIPEQRGATFAPDMHDIAPDVADIPTDVHKIEDVDEPDDLQDFPVRQWDNEFLNEPGAPPSDTRARGSRRSGKLQRGPDEDDEDYLPPAGQSTFIRANRPVPSGSLSTPRAGSRGAQVPPPLPAESQPLTRNVNTRPIAQSPRLPQLPAQPRPISRSRIPAAPPPSPPGPSRRRSNQASGRRGRVTTAVVVVVLVLLLLVGVGFFYYGTTATVTLTVPSKTLSLASFKLVASTNTRSKFPNSVTSQLLTHNASVTGTGAASGSTQQGNAKATGTVIFANKGLQNVTIPTGTVLTTGNGAIQFVVTASPVVPLGNSTVPIPVQAQNAGNEGNVGPNTITVVPATSIAAIAQASNLSISQVILTVTNPGALTGGGAAQAPAATQSDLQNLKNSLHQQLQAQVKTWLQGQVPQGDIAGKLFPDVVGSAHPLSQEQLTQVPTVGSALTSKNFQGTLSVNVSLLVVHRSSLIAAAQSQLNAAALHTQPYPYVLSTQFPVHLNVVSSSPSNDGTTITITLSASGLAMLQVDRQELSTFLAGKTKDQAISAISHGDAGPRGVESVNIDISPSFLTIMPFRSEHIHIDVMPASLPKG
jgi:hypothetical protein